MLKDKIKYFYLIEKKPLKKSTIKEESSYINREVQLEENMVIIFF